MSRKHTGKFRHVYGDPSKPEKQFLDVKNPLCSGEGNYVSSGSRFFGVAKSSGGGPVYILDHSKPGRVPANTPMLSVHKGKVWDMDFNPFIPNMIATGSNDCRVAVTSFPMTGLTEHITKPTVSLQGHQKKVVLVQWNPSASGILATGSFDRTVKVWNVEKQTEFSTFQEISDNVYSMQWNKNGSMLGTTSKDKHLRLFDPRSSETAQCVKCFDGSKSSKMFWCDRNQWVGATGFSRTAKRQLRLWDQRKMGTKPLHNVDIDQASSVLMPTFDNDTGILYLCGKGEGKVVYFELVNDERKVYSLSLWRETIPQKGGCFVPKCSLDVWKCEVGRFLKLTNKSVVPISFIVPRKAGKDVFQADIFPDCFAGQPALKSEEWLNGENREPVTMSLDPAERGEENEAPMNTLNIQEKVIQSPKTPQSVTSNNSGNEIEIENLKKRISELENEVKERESTIEERNNTIKERDESISTKDETINNLNNQLSNSNNRIKELENEVNELNNLISNTNESNNYKTNNEETEEVPEIEEPEEEVQEEPREEQPQEQPQEEQVPLVVEEEATEQPNEESQSESSGLFD